MIIVIEGADLVGKTTVINRLVSEIPNSIPVKLNVVIGLDRNCVADIERAINLTAYSLMSKDEGKVWLVDRFIISALVYSNFLNRPSKLSVEDIKARKYAIIILGADEHILVKRFKERDDKHFSIGDILLLNKLFFNFYFKNQLKITNLHYLKNNDQDQLKNVIKYTKKLVEYENKYGK